MDTIWVLVAASSQARLFAIQGPQVPLLAVHEFSHPESRQHEHDLTTDLPGRSFDSMGSGRHAMEQRVSVKEHEAQVFAREIGAYLEDARINKRFHSLIIMSAPSFLGVLRKSLSAGVNQCVIHEVDKNLVQQDPAEIRTYLPERLSATRVG